MDVLRHKLRTDDGATIHYRSCGCGEVLLFLHGLGSAGEEWAPQVAAFQDRYRVITIDFRGHGHSPAVAHGYAIERFAADVLAVMDAEQILTAHLVGLSMGGAVAFQLAVSAPERVASLAIVNSGPTARPPGVRYALMVLMRKLMARFLSPGQAAPKLAGKLFPEPDMAPLREQFIERMRGNDPVAYRRSLYGLLGWSVEKHIGGVSIPTVFIAADRDYTPVALKRHFVEQMPNARLEVVRDAHHALPLEHPDRFNVVLARHLDALVAEPEAA